MKKHRVLSCVFALFLLASVCLVPVQAETDVPDGSIEYGCNTVDAKAPLLGAGEKLDLVASAIMYEANSDTLMYTWNPDDPQYPASLVKIMTALIVLQEGNPADIVTITQELLNTVPENAVTAKLVADEVITVKDLLYCMMVGSANDAAAALAEHISGSQPAFVVKMNQYAQEFGCTATEFTDVHGLDGKQTTTARDMARILAKATENPEFLELFGTVYYTTEKTNKSEARNLTSGNYLLCDDEVEIYLDKRVTGGRTGTQDNGNRCVASVATGNGMQMICIVLGGKNTYTDSGSIRVFGGYKEVSRLLDLGFDGYQAVNILYKNQALLQTQVENGDADLVLGPNVDASCVLPLDITQDKLTYKYGSTDGISLPVQYADRVSNVQVWYGNICVAQSELYALNKVENSLYANQNVERTKQGSGWFKTLLKVLFILLLLAVSAIMCLRLHNKLRHRSAMKRSRRYRRDRRRSR